jgi:sec-independent protein translocase protein TatA
MNTLPIGLIGDIGGGELILVAVAVLLLFGGKSLPSIARTIGKNVDALRKASQDFKDQLLNADRDPLNEHPDSTSGTPGKASTPSPKETHPRDPAG